MLLIIGILFINYACWECLCDRTNFFSNWDALICAFSNSVSFESMSRLRFTTSEKSVLFLSYRILALFSRSNRVRLSTFDSSTFSICSLSSLNLCCSSNMIFSFDDCSFCNCSRNCCISESLSSLSLFRASRSSVDADGNLVGEGCLTGDSTFATSTTG